VGDRERHRRLEEEAAARKDDDVDVDVDYDYAPRWKRRQEERWAREAEEAAAALERAEAAASRDGTTPESREGAGAAAGVAPPSPLVPAARSGDDLAEAARAIVENRAEDFARTLAHLTSLVDARDEAGDTLLHLAASLDRKRCVKTLVRAGASVGARNDAGVSVVERAIEHERFELADYLVKWCERHGVELG
jgi:FOG: Ankyrin repeat